MPAFADMPGKLRRRLTMLGFIVGLVLVLTSSSLFLYRDHQRSVQALLDRSLSSLSLSWQAVQVQHRYSTATYFEEYVQAPRTLELLRLARDPEQIDRAREALFEYLSPAYQRLVERGVRQLHFHTPDGDSFLRFHHPSRFGDNLFAVRESIRQANTELRAVFGFEVGRVVSGYRTVLPILDADGQHLGSVEFSMPFKVLMEELQALMPEHAFQLLLEAERQRAILFDEQQSLYEPWPASDAFVVEDPRGLREDSPLPLPPEIGRLVAQLGQSNDLVQKMLEGRVQGFRIRADGRDYAVLQTPVIDPGETQVGVLVSYLYEPELGALDRAFRLRLLGAWLSLLALAVALYFLLRVLDERLSERTRLSVISDTLGQGLYLTNSQGRIVSMNPYASEVLGYPEDDAVGRSAHELFHSHPDNAFQTEHDCPIVSSVRAGREYRNETLFQRSDGALLEVSVVSRPLMRGDRFAGAVTVFEDIGERKQVERALLESRQRLAGIIWGTGVGTWEWNVRTGEARFNEFWAEMLGYRLEELEPVSIAIWERSVHPEDMERVEQALQSHFSGEAEHYDLEVRMRHRRGDWIWVHDRGRVISRAVDGAPEWMAGTHLDITARKLAEKQSLDLLDRLRKLTAELPGFAYQYLVGPDGSSAFVYASEGIKGIYGVTPEQVRTDASPVFEVLHGDDIGLVSEKIAVSARDLSQWGATYRVHHPDKGLIWVEGHATPERLDDGSVIWHGYINDVTERRAAELAASEARLLLQAALENSPSGLVIADAPDGSIRFANSAFRKMTGLGQKTSDHYRPGDAAEAWVWQLLDPDGKPLEQKERPLARALFEGRIVSSEEAILIAVNGERRWVSVSAAPIRDDQGQLTAAIAVYSDISQQKAAQERLQESAHHDPLTGLANRLLLVDRLQHGMQRVRRAGGQLAVVFIDLDEFKPINDSHGHAVGDQLLIELASRMSQVLRAVDTLARLGGDEFVAILTDIDGEAGAEIVAARLLDVLETPVIIDGQSLQVTASIGITLYPRDGELDDVGLLRQADQAMYQAKLQGRNCWHFFSQDEG